jgi:polyhydroxybutyrate depolymerase
MIQQTYQRRLKCALTFAVITLASLVAGTIRVSPCYASTQANVTVDGASRPYYIYIPKSHTAGQKTPVVFVLHPMTKDAAWAEQNMGWDKCADHNGFIVVYGQAASSNGTWNAGLTRSERATGSDDVGYLSAVMNDVEANQSIDMSQVFMVGFSSGAIMTAKFGSTEPNTLSAVGTVEGITGYATRDAFVPGAPLSMIAFRGTADMVTPYSSDTLSTLFKTYLWSATGTATDWAQADGCTATPSNSQIADNLQLTDYTGGTQGSEVQLVTVNGGKHEYKESYTDIIWKFFASHPKSVDKPSTQ